MLEIDIRKQRGELAIDAQITAGDGFTVLFGPSGAGKSSILRMLAGLLAPDSGSISITGDKLFDSKINLPPQQRRAGFVFQDGLLFPHMSVRRNLDFAAAGEGIDDLAEMMQIGHLFGRRPASLSGGERQRVAMARALLGQPRFLLMDEPMSSLDQGHKNRLFPYLRRIRDAARVPVLYVTHSVEETFRLADRIVLIENGKTGISGAPAEVFGAAPWAGHDNPLQGGLLSGLLSRHLDGEDLSEINVAGTAIYVARTNHHPGDKVRIRVQASDIALATSEPENLSILNRLPVEVTHLQPSPSGGVAAALKLADGQLVSANLTGLAVRRLGLAPGARALALFKTVSVNPESLD